MTDNSIGNSHFCVEFTKWTMGWKGVLEYSAITDLKKHNYARTLKSTINELTDLKKELDDFLLKVKKYNTAGNIASIAGTALLFTPFFYVGLGAIGLGSATSIGASFAEWLNESGKKARLEEILHNEEKAQKEFEETVIKFLGGSTKGFMFYMKASDIKRMYDVSSGYRAAYNGVNGAANAMKAGMKLSPFAKFLCGAGVVLSAADIYYTWKVDNETSQKIGDLIIERIEKLKELGC